MELALSLSVNDHTINTPKNSLLIAELPFSKMKNLETQIGENRPDFPKVIPFWVH